MAELGRELDAQPVNSVKYDGTVNAVLRSMVAIVLWLKGLEEALMTGRKGAALHVPAIKAVEHNPRILTLQMRRHQLSG